MKYSLQVTMLTLYWCFFIVFYVLFLGDLLKIDWAILYEGYPWKVVAPSYYPEYSSSAFYKAWRATVETRHQVALIVTVSGLALFVISLAFLFLLKIRQSKVFRWMLWVNVVFVGFFTALAILLAPLRGIRVI